MFTGSPALDKAQLLVFVHSAFKKAYDSLGSNVRAEEVDMQSQRLDLIVNDMYATHSPLHPLHEASAFKKSAYFLLMFCKTKPILNSFPNFGNYNQLPLSKYHSHQNEMIAFDFVRFMLKNSIIIKETGNVTLKNQIKLSVHSYEDFIQTLEKLNGGNDYVFLSLLLEQMAYRVNPNASYETVV